MSKINLSKIDPDGAGDISKEQALAETATLQEKLVELQEKLYAEAQQSLLIILQAMDTAGKDSTIKHVFKGINPQGVQVTSFKAPSVEELAHDFLWRVHQHTPPKGYIGIFNRSHYEDVLVVRVNNLVPQTVWEKRYAHINAFEQMLAANGTRILKFYLHISKAEQKTLLERLQDPQKHWKFSAGDLPVREQWDAYMQAYEAAMHHCHSDAAPWLVVPANRKWYRNLIITRAIVGALEAMNPRYPEPETGLEQITIPD